MKTINVTFCDHDGLSKVEIEATLAAVADKLGTDVDYLNFRVAEDNQIMAFDPFFAYGSSILIGHADFKELF